MIINEDHGAIGDAIARVEPSAIFGTQMERHVGKRLNIPCGVIAAPIHIQDFPLATSLSWAMKALTKLLTWSTTPLP